MKKLIAILFVIALTLSACLSSSEGMTSTPQATLTPEAIVTLLLPMEKPAIVASTKTITPEVPTAVDISKYTAKPTGIEGYQKGSSVAYIFDTLIPELDRLNKLANSPLPQFVDGVKPVVAELVKNGQGVEFKMNLGCNLDGNSVNCIPVAYIKIGEDTYVTILRIRNGDGTDGFFPWWNAGWWGQRRINRIIDNVLEKPIVRRVIEIEIRPGGPNDNNEILQKYFEDEDFINAIQEWIETQIFPQDYKNIVPGGAWD